MMTFYEKEDVFRFYRVNFFQEKGFLNKEEKFNNNKSINDINESDNEDGEGDNIYEMEDKSNTNDNSETEG